MNSKYSEKDSANAENVVTFKSVIAEKDLTPAQKKLIKRRNSKNFVAFLTVRSAESSTGFNNIKIVQ